jgi:hypothetical protein
MRYSTFPVGMQHRMLPWWEAEAAQLAACLEAAVEAGETRLKWQDGPREIILSINRAAPTGTRLSIFSSGFSLAGKTSSPPSGLWPRRI